MSRPDRCRVRPHLILSILLLLFLVVFLICEFGSSLCRLGVVLYYTVLLHEVVTTLAPGSWIRWWLHSAIDSH